MAGYNSFFLGPEFLVEFPDYGNYVEDLALNRENSTHLLDYINYSVIQSRSRRIPLLSASNIYRTKFDPVRRYGSFKRDPRINRDEQLTSVDYRKFNTLKAARIEKGHMTKREDVQWDLNDDDEHAKQAARSTFYYPNSVPQHDSLNNGPWKYLENSVIIKGHVPEPAKISVFTGPVLDPFDPEFKVELHDGSHFKIPVLFWKVIYYPKEDGKLYRAGFLMGQINPLKRDHLINEIKSPEFESTMEKSSTKPFLTFKDDENYQVPVSLIEDLTKLKFQAAVDRHENTKPTILKLDQVQIRHFESASTDQGPDFEVSGLLV